MLCCFNLIETFLLSFFCSVGFAAVSLYVLKIQCRIIFRNTLGHAVLHWGLLGKAEGADPKGAGYGSVICRPALRQLGLRAGWQSPQPYLMLPGNTPPPSENWQNSATLRPDPVLSQAAPPRGWQGESLKRNLQLTKYSQGQTCRATGVAQRGWTTEENLTLKIFQNQHLFPLQFYAFCR